MSQESLQSFFGWCTVLNIGFLTYWFAAFSLMHDTIYKFHGKLFRMSVETFDAIHYTGMAVYKVGIFLFSLMPYLTLALLL